MKTAMQELIEWANQYEGQMISADQVILKSYQLLEKEKEQSINLIKQTCMFMGASIIDVEISKMEFEDIYNNYYDINK